MLRPNAENFPAATADQANDFYFALLDITQRDIDPNLPQTSVFPMRSFYVLPEAPPEEIFRLPPPEGKATYSLFASALRRVDQMAKPGEQRAPMHGRLLGRLILVRRETGGTIWDMVYHVQRNDFSDPPAALFGQRTFTRGRQMVNHITVGPNAFDAKILAPDETGIFAVEQSEADVLLEYTKGL